MTDRAHVRDLIRPLAIAAREMNRMGSGEIVVSMYHVSDVPGLLMDLTPEGVHLASDLVTMTKPAVAHLSDWVGDGCAPRAGELVEGALDAVVLAHYAYCAMTRQTVERVGAWSGR